MPFAILVLLFVQCNFGLLPIAQKTVLTTLSPVSLFALRSIAGALVFQIVYLLWRGWQPRHLVRAETEVSALRFLWLAFLGISANQFLLIVALSFSQAVAAVIMVPSITLFTYLFAVLLKRESFAWNKAFTLCLGGVGVLILFADSLDSLAKGWGGSALLGNVLFLISAMAYALYLVLSKQDVRSLAPLQFTSRLFGYSLVWVFVFVGASYLFWSGEDVSGFWIQIPQRVLVGTCKVPSQSTLVGMLSFIIIGPTILNYFLNLWALRRLPASTVSGFISLQTLIGAAASSWYLHEQWKPTYGLAAFCIVSSVLLLSYQTFRVKPAH